MSNSLTMRTSLVAQVGVAATALLVLLLLLSGGSGGGSGTLRPGDPPNWSYRAWGVSATEGLQQPAVPAAAQSLTHLVLVASHAVWLHGAQAASAAPDRAALVRPLSSWTTQGPLVSHHVRWTSATGSCCRTSTGT